MSNRNKNCVEDYVFVPAATDFVDLLCPHLVPEFFACGTSLFISICCSLLLAALLLTILKISLNVCFYCDTTC